MEIAIETILEDYFRDEDIRQKHRKNETFLKLAIKNVAMARRLNLRGGLVYDCRDRTYFNIILPNNETVFKGYHKYDFPEVKTVVACHYVFLKHKWIEDHVNLNEFVDEVFIAYPPLTRNLNCSSIRDRLTGHAYSEKLFEHDESKSIVRPRYLPTKIEL
jgi:hypothetical protein